MLFAIDQNLTIHDIVRDSFSRDGPTLLTVPGVYNVSSVQQVTRDLAERGERNCLVVTFVNDAVVCMGNGDRVGSPACNVKVVCNTDSPNRVFAVVSLGVVGVQVE